MAHFLDHLPLRPNHDFEEDAMKFPTGYLIDTMNTTDLIEMRPTHKLVPDGEGLPFALCRSGSDAARIANGLRLLEQDEQAPQYSIDTSAASFSDLQIQPDRILRIKTTVTLPESEILARAREAAIASGARGPVTNAAIRAGERDADRDVTTAARALRDLAKPLSEVAPAEVDGDLAEAARLLEHQHKALSAVLRQAVAVSPSFFGVNSLAVEAVAAAIRRGRELEREARL